MLPQGEVMLNNIRKAMQNQFLTLGMSLCLVTFLFHYPMSEGTKTAASLVMFWGIVAIIRLIIALNKHGRAIRSNLAAIVETASILIALNIIAQYPDLEINRAIPRTLALICFMGLAYSTLARVLFMINLSLMGHEAFARERLKYILSEPDRAQKIRLNYVRNVSMAMSEHHRINGAILLDMAKKAMTAQGTRNIDKTT